MAQKVQTLLIDDLDGGEADSTVQFGLDGTQYEIDLNAAHVETLRHALARYIEVARRAPGTTVRRPGRTSGKTTRTDALDPTAVREWAKSRGIE